MACLYNLVSLMKHNCLLNSLFQIALHGSVIEHCKVVAKRGEIFQFVNRE